MLSKRSQTQKANVLATLLWRISKAIKTENRLLGSKRRELGVTIEWIRRRQGREGEETRKGKEREQKGLATHRLVSGCLKVT